MKLRLSLLIFLFALGPAGIHNVIAESTTTISNEDDLSKSFSEHPYTFVKFTAPWCSACKSPIYNDLAEQNPSLNFVVIDISKGSGGKIAKANKIGGFPTFLIFEKDKEAQRIVGDYNKLKAAVAAYAKKADEVPPTPAPKKVAPVVEKKVEEKTKPIAPKKVEPTPKKAEEKPKKIEPQREKSSPVHSVTTLKELNKHISGDKPALVKFYADWCGHCKTIKNFFNDLGDEFKEDVSFVEVNGDNAKEITDKYDIEGFPTFMSFHKGKKVETITGANKPRLKEHVQELQKKSKKVSKKAASKKEKAAPVSKVAKKSKKYVLPKTKTPVPVKTSKDFAEYINQDKPTVVKFFAEWCGPCQAMKPIFESMADEFNNDAYFVAINIDDARPLAKEHRVYSIPHIKVFKDGKEIDTVTGVNADMLRNTIKKHIK